MFQQARKVQATALRSLGMVGTLAMAVAFTPTAAAGFVAGEPHAAYAGHEIPLTEVSNHHCHDAMYPLIQCFASAHERDSDLASLANETTGAAGAAVATLSSYVTWYDATNYGGSSFTASTSYADLSTISWDNKISSFKSLNGGRPKWWQNTNFSGTSWHWLAGAQVPDVGSTANDQFSSVQNVP